MLRAREDCFDRDGTNEKKAGATMIFGKDRNGKPASGDGRTLWRWPERQAAQAPGGTPGAALPRFAVAATDELGDAAQGMHEGSPCLLYTSRCV